MTNIFGPCVISVCTSLRVSTRSLMVSSATPCTTRSLKPPSPWGAERNSVIAGGEDSRWVLPLLFSSLCSSLPFYHLSVINTMVVYLLVSWHGFYFLFLFAVTTGDFRARLWTLVFFKFIWQVTDQRPTKAGKTFLLKPTTVGMAGLRSNKPSAIGFIIHWWTTDVDMRLWKLCWDRF